MLLSSFAQTILKWLRVPPGASVRKAEGPSTSSAVDILENEYVQVILDITVDDICIGDSPLSLESKTDDEQIKAKFKSICDEFNTVVKDVARDLCVSGYSVLDTYVKDQKFRVLPFIDEVEFYLTKEKEIVVYSKETNKQLKDKLVFINYTKQSLQKIEDKDKSRLAFKINPSPMQVKNAERTLSGITVAENAVTKYRALLRPLRIANVDIGTAAGDVQKQTVDGIASAINSNSESLSNQAPFLEFDDNIPVLPNRKGLGKIELATDIPSGNLKDLADLDYWLSKLTLLMRFPATYMDFTKNLGDTAMSLVRSDIRYLKLCQSVQNKIVNTLNVYIQSSKLGVYRPVFLLTKYPSSEDDDVLQALSDYTDTVKNIDDFVIGSPEDSTELRLHRLRVLKDLFNVSASSTLLQKWFDDYESFILSLNDSSAGNSDEDNLDEDNSDRELGEPEEFTGPEDLTGVDESEELELPGASEDVEILEPQT